MGINMFSWMYTCNLDHIHIPVTFSHSTSILLLLVPFSSLNSPVQLSCFLNKSRFCLWKKNLWYLSLWIWLISLDMVILTSLFLQTKKMLLNWSVYLWLNKTHSLGDSNLWVWNTETNSFIPLSLWHAELNSFSYRPRSDTAESYGNSIFSFLRNLHADFHCGFSSSHSHHQHITVPFPVYLCPYLFFDFLMTVIWLGWNGSSP